MRKKAFIFVLLDFKKINRNVKVFINKYFLSPCKSHLGSGRARLCLISPSEWLEFLDYVYILLWL